MPDRDPLLLLVSLLVLVVAGCPASGAQVEQPEVDSAPVTSAANEDPVVVPEPVFADGECPAPLEPGSATRTTGDDSTALTPADEARIPLIQVRYDGWPGASPEAARSGPEWLRYCGVITALHPQLELRLAGESQPATLGLGFGSEATGSIAVGDAVVVHVQRQVIQIHRVVDVMVTDPDGRLLLASSADGTAEFAPGWSIERGPPTKPYPAARSAKKPAESRSHGMIFEHRGARAETAPNVPRKLVTDDGVWLVSGSAIGWTKGLLPPDAASYAQFWIARIE